MKDITLHEAAQANLEHLRAQGKKERTLYTYSKDFEQIEAFFGADRKLKTILAPHVGKFLKSDALLKLPKGGDRAKPTIDKTIRVFRMFLVWAKETERIDKLPLPKDFPMGRSTEKETQEDAEPEHNAAD
jgi:site-specific recombinase XerD